MYFAILREIRYIIKNNTKQFFWRYEIHQQAYTQEVAYELVLSLRSVIFMFSKAFEIFMFFLAGLLANMLYLILVGWCTIVVGISFAGFIVLVVVVAAVVLLLLGVSGICVELVCSCFELSFFLMSSFWILGTRFFI